MSAKHRTGPGMTDIFISYASADRPRVKPLVDALQQQGWSVWWDRTILAGKAFDRVIETALKDSRCVIVLWSKASVESDWVWTEADEGKRRAILVPALLDDVGIPFAFRRIQTANLVGWSGGLPSDQFSELARAISDVLSSAGIAPPNARLEQENKEPTQRGQENTEGLNHENQTQDQAEVKRLEREKNQSATARLKQVRQETDQRLERAQKEQAEKERLKLLKKREAEREKREQAEQEELERKRKARDLAKQDRLEREKQAQEQAERERLEREKAELERAAREKAERERYAWLTRGFVPGTVRLNPRDGQKYVWIPPGAFMMGCSPGDSRCGDHEKPLHQVTISKGFLLGRTPVTVGAYERFAREENVPMPEPPYGNPGWKNQRMPMVFVGWDEVKAYCKWAGGRLPTEAEWEYAARAGSTEARDGTLDEIAWHAGNSSLRPHEVGQKQPNSFGLYDMLGNVWEFVNDWYKAKYQNNEATDPQGPSSGRYRVIRGCGCSTSPEYVRVSARGSKNPDTGFEDVGFRCVAELTDR